MGFIANLFGADEIQAESDALDARKQQMDRDRAARMAREDGQAAADEYLRQTAINDQRSANAGLGIGRTVEQDVDEGFDEGLQDGANNITNAVAAPFQLAGKGLGAVLGGVWKGVPMWIWIGGAVVVFFYLGGAAIVRPYVAKLGKKGAK